MFQFSPLAPFRLCIQRKVTRHDSRRVSPFGHLRINAYVRLPEAFRSLSRPSSPVHAKASTVRPCSLDRICSLRLLSEARITPVHLILRTRVWCSSPSLGLSTQSLNPGFQCNTDQRECFPQNARPVSLFDDDPSEDGTPLTQRLQKGGDPAAGSPTATLLRLRPSHRARLRRLGPLARFRHRLRALRASMA